MISLLKKRIIFTLLFDRGSFMLSRNFRLQKVGNLSWLQKNYNFANVAFFIDELIMLDVSRGTRDREAFLAALTQVSAGCFAPVAAGGGIDSVDYARQLLRSGADKVVLNSALFEQADLVAEIASEFGQQCVVGSVDVKQDGIGGYDVYVGNGSRKLDVSAAEALARHETGSVGELYLSCIDRDGTGQGFDFGTLDVLPDGWSIPVIMAGGVGKARHFAEGLANPRVDAVATAHLFNFVGNGLMKARHALRDEGLQLAEWPDLSAVSLGKRDESSS